MSPTSLMLASLSADPALSEVLQYVVVPGFLLVVVVLSILAALTRLIGGVFKSLEMPDAGSAVAGPSSLSAREYAVVAAAVHVALRTPNDLRKVAAATSVAHEARQNKEVRIVSIEKKS